MEKLLTVSQAADLIGIKESTLYEWVGRGRIPYCKIGRLLRFRPESLESWVQIRESRTKRHRVSVDNGVEIEYSIEQKAGG